MSSWSRSATKARLGRRQFELDRLIVDHFNLHALTTHQQESFGLLDDVGVHVQVVVPELDVVRSERRAVGPLVSFPQVEGQLGVLGVPFPVFRYVRNDGCQVVGITHEVDVARGQEVRGARFGCVRQHVQHAAVFANAVVWRDNQRFAGETSGQRRQLRVANDLAVEFTDLGVFAEREFTFGETFELRQLELLRILASGDPSHIGYGHLRARRRHGHASESQQARTD